MFRLFVRIGVTTALSVLMIYLFLVFIAIYQENRTPARVTVVSTGPPGPHVLRIRENEPLSDVTLETTVREKTIAGPGETADVLWPSPYEPNQWIVVFDVDKVTRGRFEKTEIRFLVHSPSADLGVREVGQHVVLERHGAEWQHP
jgi:hypothetical protein